MESVFNLREMRVKTTMKYHYTIKMVKTNNLRM